MAEILVPGECAFAGCSVVPDRDGGMLIAFVLLKVGATAAGYDKHHVDILTDPFHHLCNNHGTLGGRSGGKAVEYDRKRWR